MRYACNVHANRSIGRQILHCMECRPFTRIPNNVILTILGICITILVGISGCSTIFKWFGKIWQLLMNSLGILNRVMSEESRVCHHKETSQFYVERKEKMAIKMSTIQVSNSWTTLRPWEREEIFREGPLCKRKSSLGVGGYRSKMHQLF